MVPVATQPEDKRQNDEIILHRLGSMDDKLDEVLVEQRDQGRRLNALANSHGVIAERLENTRKDVENLERKSDTWDKIVATMGVLGAAIASALGLNK